MTTNDDTPQTFGDMHDHRRDPGPIGEEDDAAFPAFRGWAGWRDRVEPVAPHDDYPRSSFSPCEPAVMEPLPDLEEPTVAPALPAALPPNLILPQETPWQENLAKPSAPAISPGGLSSGSRSLTEVSPSTGYW